MGIEGYNKTVSSTKAVAPTIDVSNLFTNTYDKKVNYQGTGPQEVEDLSIDLDKYMDIEITYTPKEEVPWYEEALNAAGKFLGDVGEVFISTGATVAVGTTSILSGVLDIGEGILDGGAWLASKAVGIFSEDAETAMKEFIARDLVTEANQAFYENTSIGQAINESSALKYDSEIAQGIRSVTEDIGVFATATALTVCTGGAAAPLTISLGFAYGAGEAAEDTYAINGTDTSTVQELLILGNGGLSALSWYANGKLGKGFLEIGKSISEASAKEVLSQMTKEIFSKEMLKELLKPSNVVGNAIATLMQSGGDIARIATKLYNGGEVTAEEWSLLVGELIVYFGLNVAEDALRTEITNFKAKPNTPELTSSEGLNQNAIAASSTSTPRDNTAPVRQMSINDLDDAAGEDLLNFSRRRFLNRNFFYTDEGRRIYDIYQKLYNTSFDEFNARYPGLFADEEKYFDALGSISSAKLQSIYRTIYDGDDNISIEQFNDAQDFILNRTTYSNVSLEEITFLRDKVASNQFTINPMYRDVYEQLSKKLDLVQAEGVITQRLTDFAGGYVAREQTQSIIGSFEYEVESDFRLKASDSTCVGYNNGVKSVISLQEPVQSIEDIMNHESVHQISHNRFINYDGDTGARISLSGVSRSTFNPQTNQWENVREGVNESITEYFNIISHGEGYQPSFLSGYQPGVDAIGSFVDNDLISLEKLKELYFTNKGEGLTQYFDDLSKTYNLSLSGEDVIRAFDNAALNSGDRTAGTKALNRYLKEYQKAIRKGTGLFSRFKGIFGA